MTRKHFWLRSFVGCLVLFCSTGVILADTIEWTDPNDGDFDVAGNWTNTTGADPAPPNAGGVAVPDGGVLGAMNGIEPAGLEVAVGWIVIGLNVPDEVIDAVMRYRRSEEDPAT